MNSTKRGWAVLALFFCSGATALVYEVVWSKFLSQMFGSTIYAQTVVLAAFMGGLALGNKIFGRRADRWARPVRAYGYLEIVIGFYAFFFPTLDQLADLIFVRLGSSIVEHAGLLLALKGVLSVALLLGPTILMGGTLPLLAAWLQKSSVDAGRRSARFYSVNSLGAVAGSCLAGFWLVQNVGLVAALQLTALVNVVIGAIAILLSKTATSEPAVDANETPAQSAAVSPETLRWAGAIVALTGAVSMGLEVLSSRSLALIFGSSLQSFAIVLMAFILGIGLGSAWIASPRRSGASSEKLIVLLLCIAAAWVALLVFNIERWVDFYRIARSGLGRTDVGYVYHQILAGGIALVILGLPAACIGAVLPLMIRAMSKDGAPLGEKVGALLTWNTLGAVAGTLLTGFVLMPHAGLRNAFGVLALVLGLMALAMAWRRGWRAGLLGGTVACVFVGSLFVFGDAGWRHVMSSGVFRARETAFNPTTMPLRKQHMKILFYEDAADATVSVEQGDGIGAPADIGLRVNGKPDASTRVDLSTQLLVAHLPMIARPGAKDVFVLGLGSGVSAGALRGYPVEHIVIAENCEPVIRASKIFEEWNRHALDDPRTQLWREDARTVLKLRPQKFDVIITQPSNPWTTGVGSVFSREYYELAASRLKPGGVVAQWFHVYEMHDGIVGLVLRTFGSVFPFVEVWDTAKGDIVMLGSLQPWPSDLEVFRQSFAIEGVRADLAVIGIQSPEALWARQVASQRTGFAIAGDGSIQRDLFPVLEYAAPKAFYIGTSSQMLAMFDERTRQQSLAPTAKRAALRALPFEQAQSVFAGASTINEELLDSIRGLPSAAGVPCVFRTNSPAVSAISQKSEANQALLTQAVAALNAGDTKQAEKLAGRVLNQDPGNASAGYVARIAAREEQLRQAGYAKR
jgi:spermidine synthase